MYQLVGESSRVYLELELQKVLEEQLVYLWSKCECTLGDWGTERRTR